MPYNRKARRSRRGGETGQRVPEGIVLVAGRGGSKDAAYAFKSDTMHGTGAVPRPLANIHGWAFWDSIGRPTYVCAPMVEQSELSFRQLCRRYGTTLAYTPMFHARLFLEDARYRAEMFDSAHDGNPAVGDRPLFVQFCANQPDTLLSAARLVEAHCDAVDINFGCPQGIAKKGNYGSFLMDDLPLIYKLINTLHKNLKIPVTCKIRRFDDEAKTLQYAKMCADAGASVLTIHGRTREHKGPSAPLADWGIIAKVRAHVGIPVISNGNIVTFADVEDCLEQTGCAAVMSAEWLRRNPALFAAGGHGGCSGGGGGAAERGRGGADVGEGERRGAGEGSGVVEGWVDAFRLAREYLEIIRSYPTPDGYVKNHLFKLLSTVQGGFNDEPDLRQRMANVNDRASMESVVEELLQRKRAKHGDAPSFPSGTRADLLPKAAPTAPGAGSSRARREEEEADCPCVDLFSMDM